jgi:hypothetical protein
MGTGVGAASKAYIARADGSGLGQLPVTGGTPATAIWSPDQKFIYLSVLEKVGPMATVWRWSAGSSDAEKFVNNCGQLSDIDPSGQYLLGNVLSGEGTGIYEVSTSDRKCTRLLPGITTFSATFARDGKSFMYAVGSRGAVTSYRQLWKNGKKRRDAVCRVKGPLRFSHEVQRQR